MGNKNTKILPFVGLWGIGDEIEFTLWNTKTPKNDSKHFNLLILFHFNKYYYDYDMFEKFEPKYFSKYECKLDKKQNPNEGVHDKKWFFQMKRQLTKTNDRNTFATTTDMSLHFGQIFVCCCQFKNSKSIFFDFWDIFSTIFVTLLKYFLSVRLIQI